MAKKRKRKNKAATAKVLAEQTTRKWLAKVNPNYLDTQCEVKAEPTEHWMYYGNLGGAESRLKLGAPTAKRR